MKLARNLGVLRKVRRPVVLAAGVFDGVHVGHAEIIRRAVESARARRGEAWVLTFDVHPVRLLSPSTAPLLLTSLKHKLALLRRLGPDGCVVLRFDRRFAGIEPEEFAGRLLRWAPSLREVVVGRSWRFGRKARGTPRTLRDLVKERNIAVTIVPSVRRNGAAVSSTRIRRCVIEGRLREAEVLLGHPFGILGEVVPGRGVGRRLGFPTANLNSRKEALPPDGVYAARAKIGRLVRNGVVNIGTRPTFGRTAGKRVVAELHIPGFSGDLSGRDIEVTFCGKLRDERSFASAADLKRQIARDVAAALKALKSGRPDA